MIVFRELCVDARANSGARVRAGAILRHIHADTKLSTLLELRPDPAHVYFTFERVVTAIENRAPRNVQLVRWLIAVLEDNGLVR